MLKKRSSRFNAVDAFTLIEVLVVLLILTIVTLIAMITFHDFGRYRQEQYAVQQLQQTLQVAEQQAILQPVVLGLVFTVHGYRFYRYQPAMGKQSAAWLRLRDDQLSNTTAFAPGTRMQLKMADRDAQVVSGGAVHPSIVLMPSGYVTPFELRLQYLKRPPFVMRVLANGVIVNDVDKQ